MLKHLQMPFIDQLQEASSVLIAGAGGGYDVFSGLPLYFALREEGKTVHLANLSFSRLKAASGRRLTPAMLEVTPESGGSQSYFPERYLSEWFRTQGEDVPIYSLTRTGARPLKEAYETLIDELGIDTLLLIDGGTDSLMRGDESGLGTPHEDIASIAATHDLQLPRKMLACLGFGVDTYHGICHFHFLEAVAELTQAGACLGVFSLLNEMPAVQQYRRATMHVFEAMPHHKSIVSASILSAIEGHYDDYHMTERTLGSKLWINPLMPLYWCFDLDAAAKRVGYLDEVKRTETFAEIDAVIRSFRSRQEQTRSWRDIPV